ncbi:MAG TPA: hypothetical protein PLN33_20125, partial [Hyphomonadaceae bacterium]|nr:hypothetical protein [Hyphomonadaceae bacterium]
VRHKHAMEQLIRDLSESHQIVRLPQVVGMGAKAATVVEYFHGKIMSGDQFDIWGKAGRVPGRGVGV